MPSQTHMAMVAMQDAGLLKHVISQNVDGLHRKSGILRQNISELHGNTYLEQCKKCGSDFLRDFKVRVKTNKFEHQTGRFCVKCQAELFDSIINFGEPLNFDIYATAEQHADNSDICLCMGTSMRVEPACSLPLRPTASGGKMVICNLQKTIKDDMANLVIHAKCDDMIELLMKKLQIEIPKFKLQRWIEVELIDSKTPGEQDLVVKGIDSQG